MSIDRSSGLFGWTNDDILRLMARVRRRAPRPTASPCSACEATDHSHRSRWIGPYLICRCLSCPVLVVRTNE